MTNRSSHENQTTVSSVLDEFYHNISQLAVCFKLQGVKQSHCMLFMHHSNTSGLPLVYHLGDQGDPVWVLSNHIPLLAPAGQSASRSFCGCTVQMFNVILFAGRNFNNIPFLEASEPHKFICMCCFFLCQIVHLNFIVHMQMKWNLF